jgi:hypothetical protein
MSEAYGTTIFCDDIRDEITGKKTYVGVYLNEMILQSPFPAVLPQFALAITYLEPLDWPILPVNIKIFIPGEISDEEVAVDIDLPIDVNQVNQTSQSDPLAKFRASIMHLRISPFVIHKEGHVKVRAYRLDNEIRLGSIKVRIAKDHEKSAFA